MTPSTSSLYVTLNNRHTTPFFLQINTNIQQQGPEGMNVHMRGGGEGEDVCCGV